MQRLLPLLLVLAPGQAQADGGTAVADHVVVEKAARRLTLYAQGAVMARIDGLQFGDAPRGPKRFQGDERTPEGRYAIGYGNPDSSFHLSLHITYPNAADRAFAEAHGRSAGGLIFIHGQPNALPGADDGARVPGDWTDGCIAVTNQQIELLWAAVPDGTVIDILP